VTAENAIALKVLLMNWECVILVFFPVVLAMTIQFITQQLMYALVPNHYEPFGVAIESNGKWHRRC